MSCTSSKANYTTPGLFPLLNTLANKHICVPPPEMDNIFCSDSLFHADIGTTHYDFLGGPTSSLYASARKLVNLPDHVKVWTGHDCLSSTNGYKKPVPWMTVRDHKTHDKYVAPILEQRGCRGR
ncbi:hypothetical protein K504DRAFT_531992 [Pleomassaria siparia CBS 279.74]|uniref:Metallo-beta-lactamase domain-containing protein n=1 Tax=Pleomassaria siparia CBS 279.74 TaxID=1314801 RepID=A0A6G1KEZ6_9PLEO|nr:hypothetical protein K504DRAFT_531992 [Pleomassaria siparia CBS 279.74]